MTPLSRRSPETARGAASCLAHWLGFAFALVLSLLLTACQPPGALPPVAGIPTMKCPTIPQPRAAEPTPPKPGSDEPSALAPGHWEWTVGTYEWLPPAWLPRPPHPHRPTAPILWQPGYWTPDAGACVWTPGRFIS